MAEPRELVGAASRMTRLYMILDKVSRTVLGIPFLERHDGPAVRAFYDVLSDARTLPGQHPGDFDLIYIGELWTDGTVEASKDGPVVVATGAGWVEGRKREEAAHVAQS